MHALPCYSLKGYYISYRVLVPYVTQSDPRGLLHSDVELQDVVCCFVARLYTHRLAFVVFTGEHMRSGQYGFSTGDISIIDTIVAALRELVSLSTASMDLSGTV